MTLRLGFLGTGDFAVPALKALHAAGHELALVICQPDRPRGRGHQLQAPPLKLAAQELGLTVFQPEKLRAPEALQVLLDAKLDLGCVVAYGQILPQAALDAPRLGCVNVHASLLPRWRGAAPIEWALAAGDEATGVCVQRMVYKLDAGAVLLSQRRVLGPDDDAPKLHAELAVSGAALLLQALQGLEQGSLQAVPQDEAGVTLAPLLKKSDGYIDLHAPRQTVLNRFRAFKARPGASVQVQGGELLKVHAMADAGPQGGEPGRLLECSHQGFKVACADGAVWLEQVQGPGAKAMAAEDYARGHAVASNSCFIRPEGA